jgi:4-hydroxybenzoate polyprenyltransferase/phosphoserine phosphatase
MQFQQMTISTSIPQQLDTTHPDDLNPVPLCVDLDGTLVQTDTLVESVFALATDWRITPAFFHLFRAGRASFKQRIAALTTFDPALLPYNEEFLAYLRQQRELGRRLILATAADSAVANRVAEYVGLFDEVVSSNGLQNFKGAVKAEALVARFGRKGFDYAGNDASDLAVWRAARRAIVVNGRRNVIAAARSASHVEREFTTPTSQARALMQSMRPHQWVKNFLVFVPIVTAHATTDLEAWISGALLFTAFCVTASGIYIFNDLVDLSADRRHPRKRLRPFASGTVPLHIGAMLGSVLLLAGVTLGLLVGGLAVIVAYTAMSIGYSVWLKERPLVDVFMLAGLYTIRLFGGGEVTGHRLSLWLLGFSSFLFLSLALVKRVEELTAAAREGRRLPGRRGYLPTDAAILQILGCASAFASSLVLALFVQAEANAQRYASPGLLWSIVPLMLFWQCRLWLSTSRGYMHDDPIVYAARDWVSWLVGATLVMILIGAKSVVL